MIHRLRPFPLKAIAEFAFRCSLARAFFFYGYDKLSGTMFNNAPADIMNRKLSEIDMFHLTWYWFNTNKEISWSIGILQILAAVLLLFNKTKIIGTLMFLPILSVILLIDIYCAASPGLSSRVFFYICVCLVILYRQRARLQYLLINPVPLSPLPDTQQGKTINSAVAVILYFILFLILAFGLEVLVLVIANSIFKVPANFLRP